MSRLVTLDPDITLIKEPEGYQFGKQIRSDDNVTDAEVKLVSLAPVASASKTGNPMDPIPDNDMLHCNRGKRQTNVARTLGTG